MVDAIDEVSKEDLQSDDDEPEKPISFGGAKSRRRAMQLRESDSEDDSPIERKSESNDEVGSIESSDINDQKQPTRSTLSNLYDSESSDECENGSHETSCRDIEPTELITTTPDHDSTGPNKAPQRMSAKQAMDQMQKIKSESARMLREKRFHLPYHRPKPISLKDIMSKKKIEFIPGQKKLNLRMNLSELEEYAKKLKEKEKEMIEMCKSESEDEDSEITDHHEEGNDNSKSFVPLPSENVEIDISLKDDESKILQNTCKTPEIFENNVILASEQNDSQETHTPTSNGIDSQETCTPTSNGIDSQQTCSPSTSNGIDTQETNTPSTSNETESMKLYLETEGLTEDSEVLKNVESTLNNILSDNAMEMEQSNIETCNDLDEEIAAYEPSTTRNEKIESEKHTQMLSEKPIITGCPGSYIDLSDPSEMQKISGVDLLKQRFFYHSKIKTKDEIERQKEKTEMPGMALMNFKRELEYQINKQRLEDWSKKRQQEVKKDDNELNDELSGCEKHFDDNFEDKNEIDKEEEYDFAKETTSIEVETDIEEDDDDDIDSEPIEKIQPKCDYIDDEAESDEDLASSDIESDNCAELDEAEEEKKRPSRIIKPVDSSDSSDDEKENVKSTTTIENTRDNNDINVVSHYKEDTSRKTFSDDITKSTDLFESQDSKKANDSYSFDSEDFLPLGQKFVGNNTTPQSCTEPFSQDGRETSIESKGKPYLASLISPMSNLIGADKESNSDILKIDDLPNFMQTPKKQENFSNLQKNLFIESDELDNVEEIADLCSGKFPTQLYNKNVEHHPEIFSSLYRDEESELTQNTENELLQLCSGKFITPPIQNSDNRIDNVNNKSDKCLEMHSGDKPKNISNFQKPASNILSFFTKQNKVSKDNSNMLVENCDDNTNEHKSNILSNLSPLKSLMISSSDESEDEEVSKCKNKKPKRKKDRKRAKPLQISDDESDNESQLSSNSYQENHIGDNLDVNYDSEENEIPIEETELDINVKEDIKTKKTSEFFDNEAELTSEDEWKGSGDEDERGLDKLEWEEGDNDVLDERKVTKELERIHRHQMMDQDLREVKILQDILLEDDGLEGGTRERKFKWKNLDSGIEAGAIVGEDNQDEAIDDVQNEEQWRKQRHERETFLREQLEKETVSGKNVITESEVFKMSSRVSFMAPLTPNVSTTDFINKVQINKLKNDNINQNIVIAENETVKTSKDMPSPIKKPFTIIKGKFKGFLSRGEASLNRLASLAKTGASEKEGETKNLSNHGKKGNFVFTTVSPPCNNTLDETTKKIKRKNMENVCTPVLIKKFKTSEGSETKFKKNLFDNVN